MKPKRQERIMTGLTYDEFGSQLQLADFLEGRGEKPPEGAQCYLCKRRAGEKSVNYIPGNRMAVATPEIAIFSWKVDFGDDITMIYLLCQECSALLKGLTKMIYE